MCWRGFVVEFTAYVRGTADSRIHCVCAGHSLNSTTNSKTRMCGALLSCVVRTICALTWRGVCAGKDGQGTVAEGSGHQANDSRQDDSGLRERQGGAQQCSDRQDRAQLGVQGEYAVNLCWSNTDTDPSSAFAGQTQILISPPHLFFPCSSPAPASKLLGTCTRYGPQECSRKWPEGQQVAAYLG